MRSAVLGRTTQIWLTPHGFIKAATATDAAPRIAAMPGTRKTIVTVTTPLKVTLTGVLNEQHLLERIETWFANPVLGDMKLEAVFSGYKDFAGVTFPTRIVQRSGGYPILDLTVTDVVPNAPLALPGAPTGTAAVTTPPPQPEKIADGIVIIPGNAKSVAVEFRDHVIVVDASEHEARSLEVIDHIKRLFPGKPIRYVINTHSHFDHSGGLRTYAAEGATIVTHAGNIPYYQQVWANPRTIDPDRLARSGRTPAFEGIVGSRTFRDDTRELVVYHYAGNMHNAGMLMVHLPRERILIEADSFTPPANSNEPPTAVANLVQCCDAVDRLRLDVEQLVPIHGRVTTLDEARAVADRFRKAQIF
jgi:glyoxylase-like metal-dependent hydrolase (beta-lactamase superfamily II)